MTRCCALARRSAGRSADTIHIIAMCPVTFPSVPRQRAPVAAAQPAGQCQRWRSFAWLLAGALRPDHHGHGQVLEAEGRRGHLPQAGVSRDPQELPAGSVRSGQLHQGVFGDSDQLLLRGASALALHGRPWPAGKGHRASSRAAWRWTPFPPITSGPTAPGNSLSFWPIICWPTSRSKRA